jgi:hypothetical protein
VDWRSSFERVRARRSGAAIYCFWVSLTLCLALASGCGRHAVRASEKEFLADRVMIFDSDGQEAAADEHVLGNREGSTGGRGTAGGGCGCN